MRCPHCGHDNAVEMNFCGECGTRLAALCRECGARNAPAQKFCGECGARLEPGASSRQFPSHFAAIGGRCRLHGRARAAGSRALEAAMVEAPTAE